MAGIRRFQGTVPLNHPAVVYLDYPKSYKSMMTDADQEHFSDFLNEEDGTLDDGLDLEQLSQEYGDEVAEQDPFGERIGSDSEESESQSDDEYFDVSPTSILEGMLFVGNDDNRFITSKEMAALMRGVSPKDIESLVDELNANYRSEGVPFEIVTDGLGFKLDLHQEFAFCRDRFYREQKAVRLSQPVIDVLAMVAYLQPVTKATLEEKRMKPCGSLLNQLIRRQLIQLERIKSKGENAKTVYRTTDRFLELFGLGSIDEIPQSQFD